MELIIVAYPTIQSRKVFPVKTLHYGNEARNKEGLKGRLIIVEGIDGSGKSTQIHLLEQWLRSRNIAVFLTEWNSSDMVKQITSKGKKKGKLTPTTFSLLHATDFADRYERKILPLLRAGYIVLADRYVYTAFARDIVRGCSRNWVYKVYSYALKPDLTFYFKVSIDVAIERILVGRPKLKYYEAGMDLNLSNDPYESYRIFQQRIIDEYDVMAQDEGFAVIDGTSAIEEQQAQVRDLVKGIIPRNQRKILETEPISVGVPA
jgi:dTMP kinase